MYNAFNRQTPEAAPQFGNGHTIVDVELPAAGLAHQRPDDVRGDWELVAPENRNIHQRVAAATGGYGTLANATSVLGGVLTAVGTEKIARGFQERDLRTVIKGVGFVAVGRILDIVDGLIAHKTKTRGEVGALLDSGIDKANAAHALFRMATTGALSKKDVATTTLLQATNVASAAVHGKKEGGPNPSKSGKYGTALMWAHFGTAVASKVAEVFGSNRAAKISKTVKQVAGATSLGVNAHATSGYVKRTIGVLSRARKANKA